MIFITGDTHGSIDIDKLSTKHFPEQKNLSKNDYVIICGDFGCVWDGGGEDRYYQKWLNQKSFTTLFIDGNHENFNLLNAYPVEEWNGGKVHKINESVIHLMRGQIFHIDGHSFFTMGGADSYDKSRRKAGVSWWPQEMPTDSEIEIAKINLKKSDWKIDYVITHTCSGITFDNLRRYSFGLSRKYVNTPIEIFFNQLENRLTFKKWFFGHYHDDGQIDDFHTVIYREICKI